MADLTSQEIAKLHRIITIAKQLITKGKPAKRGRLAGNGLGKSRNSGKRIRRSGKELAAFRKMIKAERKKGVSVDALARKHGISTAYIYMMR